MLPRLERWLRLFGYGVGLVACSADLEPGAAPSSSSAGAAIVGSPEVGGSGSGAAGVSQPQAGSVNGVGGGGERGGSAPSGGVAAVAAGGAAEAGMGGASADCDADDCAPPALLVLDIDYQVQQTGY